MFSRRWDHPGKKEIAFSMKGITPALLIVVDPAVDGPTLATSLTERIKECVTSYLCESVIELLEYQDFVLRLDCTREEILLSASEYEAQFEANMQELRELSDSSSAKFDEEIDNNPDNGKLGMWLVSGVRHSCLVNGVSTAREAMDKAIASGEVGSWEFIEVRYLDPSGPQCIPV